MTYLEFRNSFATQEEFERAFGKMPEEEARELISTIEGSISIKACAFSAWHSMLTYIPHT